MANLKEVRTRIASVSSTQQITSAMKMVSAAKFRRAQNAVIGMRPYAAQLNDIIADIDTGDGVATPYHAVRPAQKVVLVVVTSNKGLCGAFNSNVLKLANQRIAHWRAEGAALRLVCIGRKASEMLVRQKDLKVASYDELLDSVAAAGGMGFGQALIIHNGESIRPLWRDNLGSNKVTHYRALCEKDGQLCIVDSRDEVEYATFVEMLEAFEPRHALYLDMGAGWNHSWWRDKDGKVHEIHPVADKSRYCTNWITFYK